MQDNRAYILVMPLGIVAADLHGIIAAARPGAAIHHVTEPSEVPALLESLPSVAGAILDLDPDDPATAQLAEAIAMQGGVVVLIGDAAEERADRTRWQVLDRPFASESAIAILIGFPPVSAHAC